MENIKQRQASILHEIKAALKAISPAFSNPYQDPASEKELDELRRFINKELPVDFECLYSLCNGCERNGPQAFAYEQEFLSIERCLAEMKTNLQVLDDLDDMPLTLEYADAQIDASLEYSIDRIPFASSALEQICVDLCPSENGTYGQVIYIDSEDKVGIFLAHSLTEFLEQFLDDIKQGHYKPHADSDSFLTIDIDISLSNWKWSKRWQRVPFDRSNLAPYEA